MYKILRTTIKVALYSSALTAGLLCAYHSLVVNDALLAVAECLFALYAYKQGKEL